MANKIEHPKDEFLSIPELLKSYKQTLKDVQKVYDSYTAEINYYKDKSINPDRGQAQQAIQRLEAERSEVSGMISDLQYCIEWMETARRPGNMRGIERRSYEQRNVFKDAYWWSKYAQSKDGNKTLSDADMQKLDDLLGCLNKEQYEVFKMVRGRCFTYEECANALGMTKSNVQYHLERAEELLKEKVKGGRLVELQGTLF